MTKDEARKTRKKPTIWGWSYINDGFPAAITKNDRTFLCLDTSAPSQLRHVREVLRLLRKAEGKGSK